MGMVASLAKDRAIARANHRAACQTRCAVTRVSPRSTALPAPPNFVLKKSLILVRAAAALVELSKIGHPLVERYRVFIIS